MSASLYNIGEDLAKIVHSITEKLESGMSADDPEIQDALRSMVSSEGDWKEKAIRVGLYIRQRRAEAEMIKAESKRLAEKATSHSKQADKLADLLLQQMQTFGVGEIPDVICPIKLRENAWSVTVDNPEGLPPHFQRTKTTVEADKKALLEARLTCGGLPGVTFARSVSIKIG